MGIQSLMMQVVLKALYILLHKHLAHSLTSLFLQTTRASATEVRVYKSPATNVIRETVKLVVPKPSTIAMEAAMIIGSVRPTIEPRSNATVTIALTSGLLISRSERSPISTFSTVPQATFVRSFLALLNITKLSTVGVTMPKLRIMNRYLKDVIAVTVDF